MEEIESISKQESSITKAGAIRRMLDDPTFVFWLTVFHNIMPPADILYTQIQLTYTAVSYTHLDVYKRQSLSCVRKN